MYVFSIFHSKDLANLVLSNFALVLFPGYYEYDDINGFYKPSEAVTICEEDPACGGLTFKGTPLKFGTLAKRRYKVYFFHFVPEGVFAENKTQYFHWTSYMVDKRKKVLLRNLHLVEGKTRASCIHKKR